MSSPLPTVLTRDRLPPRLSDLPDPPAALYLRGELPRGPSVAIVGTRTPTPEGVRFAQQLARELAAAGVAVLSGGALGIDTAAHRGALAAGAVTVVVAPAGFEAAYPPENVALFRRILKQGGAYVALVPDDHAATRASFFPRNECLVALAHAIVVVQADVRSGARNAAACARRIGRPLFVVPSAPWISKGRGCLLELRLGALLCERARDVLAVLEQSGLALVAPPGRVQRRAPGSAVLPSAADQSAPGYGDTIPLERYTSTLESDETRVVAAVQAGCTHVDALCVHLGMPAARVHALLLTLELRGVLVADPPGRLSIVNSVK